MLRLKVGVSCLIGFQFEVVCDKDTGRKEEVEIAVKYLLDNDLILELERLKHACGL